MQVGAASPSAGELPRASPPHLPRLNLALGAPDFKSALPFSLQDSMGIAEGLSMLQFADQQQLAKEGFVELGSLRSLCPGFGKKVQIIGSLSFKIEKKCFKYS